MFQQIFPVCFHNIHCKAVNNTLVDIRCIVFGILVQFRTETSVKISQDNIIDFPVVFITFALDVLIHFLFVFVRGIYIYSPVGNSGSAVNVFVYLFFKSIRDFIQIFEKSLYLSDKNFKPFRQHTVQIEFQKLYAVLFTEIILVGIVFGILFEKVGNKFLFAFKKGFFSSDIFQRSFFKSSFCTLVVEIDGIFFTIIALYCICTGTFHYNLRFLFVEFNEKFIQKISCGKRMDKFTAVVFITAS